MGSHSNVCVRTRSTKLREKSCAYIWNVNGGGDGDGGGDGRSAVVSTLVPLCIMNALDTVRSELSMFA